MQASAGNLEAWLPNMTSQNSSGAGTELARYSDRQPQRPLCSLGPLRSLCSAFSSCHFFSIKAACSLQQGNPLAWHLPLSCSCEYPWVPKVGQPEDLPC